MITAVLAEKSFDEQVKAVAKMTDGELVNNKATVVRDKDQIEACQGTSPLVQGYIDLYVAIQSEQQNRAMRVAK